MKNPTRILVLVIAGLSLTPLLATSTHAASPPDGNPNGWYFGGSVGLADLEAEVHADTSSDTSLRFLGGYRFADHFALETGFVDLGDIDLRPHEVAHVFPLKIQASGFTLAGIGRVPLGAGFAVEGRLGAFFWDGNAQIPGFALNPGDIHAHFGLGASWAASRHIALTADWTRYEMTGLSSNVVSLGMRIHLRRAGP